MERAPLPRHDEIAGVQRAVELGSIAAAAALLAWQAGRLALAAPPHAGLLLAAAAGVLAADLASGIVHWTADTWGSETLPILGRRVLRPFRVHHVNPDDFIRRDFVDTNGDVSMLVVPFLATAAVVPVDGVGSAALATGLVSFAGAGWLTNQVHQWAHLPHPPRAVAWLQRRGVLLSPSAHGRHHRPPYAANYCIATGWLNRPLAAIRFFPRMERLVTCLTGLRPRSDDASFASRAGA